MLAAATIGNIGGLEAQAAMIWTLSHDVAQVRYAPYVAFEKRKA